ncbi:MAG: Gfo/Idh/MocA family protein [Candidatus Fervidibacter sp.]|uniref:Gfo/Idh/MocA family protein n=1 Tax=Candidatus Fervidibacter sp. TaxID=3100871 RepID=UPI004049652A
MADAIGFVVVGLGMGRNRAKMVKRTEGAELIGVADINEERAREVSEELGCDWHTDFRYFLDREDVHVVWVMTPLGIHADIAVPALEAGKHVIVTKPMEVTLERADKMIEAAERNNKLLLVDFDMRYLKGAWQIRKAISKGLFGKLILLEGRLKWFRSQEYYSRSGWRGTWRYDGGGSLANQTIHLIDQLVWLGGEVESVEAARIGIFAHEIETEDLGVAIFRFRNGAMGTVLGTTTFPKDAYAIVEVHGDKGGAIMDVYGQVQWFFRDNSMTPPEIEPPFANSAENMVAAIRNGTLLVCDGREGRKSLELLTAIYQSAKTGKSVKL